MTYLLIPSSNLLDAPSDTSIIKVLLPLVESAQVAAVGFTLRPGHMGENVTTAGIDLLALPRGARLQIGPDALIEVTGLRNPCAQINAFEPGLLKTMVGHDDKGRVIRKAGIMAIVLQSGVIRPGDKITVTLPQEPHHALDRV